MALNFVNHNPWVFAFGLLGNIFSFIVFLAPVPTFIRVYKKKSTEGFQSIPYVVALFSAMLLIYYASLNAEEFLLITINSIGLFIESIYIALYIAYAPKQARVFTLRFFLLLDVGGFCSILLITQFLVKPQYRARVIGFICGGLSVSVFAAPLSIMRTVIRTKSVEFMPFSLSFFLTISAVMWLFYGLLLKDFYVALPNTLGFTFGMAQMILYAIYRNAKPAVIQDHQQKLPQHKGDIVMTTDITTTTPNEEPPQSNSDEEAADAVSPSSLPLPSPSPARYHDDKYCMDQILNNDNNNNHQGPIIVTCQA